jgi:hypothetical protein
MGKSACGSADELEAEAEFFCRFPRFSIFLEEAGEENKDFLVQGEKSDGPLICGFWDRRPCMHFFWKNWRGGEEREMRESAQFKQQILDLT